MKKQKECIGRYCEINNISLEGNWMKDSWLNRIENELEVSATRNINELKMKDEWKRKGRVWLGNGEVTRGKEVSTIENNTIVMLIF